VFVLAVAVVAALATATDFREIGDQAGDLSQRLLERLGGRRHLLKYKIVAPSEKRIRTLIQQIDATVLDQIIGGRLRDLAEAGRLEPLLTAPAIDGKHLRGTGGVVLFSAMLHDDRVVIAQREVPEGTNEISQGKELLDPLDLDGVVVTGDADGVGFPTPRRSPGSVGTCTTARARWCRKRSSTPSPVWMPAEPTPPASPAWPKAKNLAISLLHMNGITKIKATLQETPRPRPRRPAPMRS
jgi:hypothetical protein